MQINQIFQIRSPLILALSESGTQGASSGQLVSTLATGAIDVRADTVCRALRKMRTDGLVESSNIGLRNNRSMTHIYTLTNSGKELAIKLRNSFDWLLHDLPPASQIDDEPIRLNGHSDDLDD